MTSLDHIKELATRINYDAEEITIVGNRVEENLFNARDVPSNIKDHFLTVLNEHHIDVNDVWLEQFSFQPADGVAYDEDKFMLVYSGGKKDCFLHPEIGVINPHDDYCVNHFLDSGKKVTKFYDLDIENHDQPNLPGGARLIEHWGQGVSENPTVKDAYFLHHDVAHVAKFLNLPQPYLDEVMEFCTDTSFDKVFGLTYNAQTLAPLKLKLYYYPKDPTVSYTVFDEINE